MRAVMLDVPQYFLDYRRERGHDKSDEMWDGELHMVPPASGDHGVVNSDVFLVLAPRAKARGLTALTDGNGLFRPGVDDDWRVPDQMYARPELRTHRGIEGPASLVVEFLSPHDETYQKLPWYGELGVGEVLVVVPGTRAFELFANRDGRMELVGPDADGSVVVQCLGVRLATAGGRLRITWDGGAAEV